DGCAAQSWWRLLTELGRREEDLGAIRRSLAGTNGNGQTLQRLSGSLSFVAERLQLVQFASGANDRRRAIDLVAELETFQAAIGSLLDVHKVRMQVEYPEREVLRTEMRPEHFHCLLQILTLNSLDWLGKTEERRIRGVLEAEEDFCELVFSDTGTGIPPQLSGRFFEPQFSMKEGGRGMGLTIARRLVETHGGYIHVILDGRRRGANIRFTLPRKRSRATFQNGH